MRKRPNHNNTNDRSDCENVLDSEGSVSEEILTICGLLIIKILTLRAPLIVNICIFLLKLEHNILNSAGTYEATGDH